MTVSPDLVARIEAASGPSRELDAEIEAAMFGGKASHQFTQGSPAERVRFSYGAGTVFLSADASENRGHVLCSHHRTAALVTSDLNAAYDLAERLAPGWTLSIIADEATSVSLYRLGGSGVERVLVRRPDQHLALAICAAAIKAAGGEK